MTFCFKKNVYYDSHTVTLRPRPSGQRCTAKQCSRSASGVSPAAARLYLAY